MAPFYSSARRAQERLVSAFSNKELQIIASYFEKSEKCWYMYAESSGFFDAPVLRLVRSEPDGVTDRTVLNEENFVLMMEALWAPDASFVVIVTAPDKNCNQYGGVLELYYTGGQKSSVWLAPFGEKLKWGP